MLDRNYFVLCEDNCRFPAMTKEQILTAIMQAVNEGTIGDIDTGFITTIKTINGKPLQFFVGKQSEYESLTEEQKENLFALITNDTSKEGIETAIESLRSDFDSHIEGVMGGSVAVPNATHATKADSATSATKATNADKVLHGGKYKGISEILTETENFDAAGTYLGMTVGNADHAVAADRAGSADRADRDTNGVVLHLKYWHVENSIAENSWHSELAGNTGLKLTSNGFYHLLVKMSADSDVLTDIGVVLFELGTETEKTVTVHMSVAGFVNYRLNITGEGCVRIFNSAGAQETILVHCRKVGNA